MELQDTRRQLEQVNNALQNERQSRQSYIAGDIRRYESEYKDLLDQLESERRTYKQIVTHNKMYLANAKKLGSERATLLEDIASLRSQLLLDKKEIKQLRQQLADNARAMRELKRELRRPLLEAKARATEAEAVQAAVVHEMEMVIKEVRESEKEAMKELRKAVQEAKAAAWRAGRKEAEVDLKIAKAQGEARRAREKADRIVQLCDQVVTKMLKQLSLTSRRLSWRQKPQDKMQWQKPRRHVKQMTRRIWLSTNLS